MSQASLYHISWNKHQPHSYGRCNVAYYCIHKISCLALRRSATIYTMQSHLNVSLTFNAWSKVLQKKISSLVTIGQNEADGIGNVCQSQEMPSGSCQTNNDTHSYTGSVCPMVTMDCRGRRPPTVAELQYIKLNYCVPLRPHVRSKHALYL